MAVQLFLEADDPAALVALQQVLRVAAAGRGEQACAEEIVRVVNEVVSDGDRDEVAQRVAWLLWVVGSVYGRDHSPEATAERLRELESDVEQFLDERAARS